MNLKPCVHCTTTESQLDEDGNPCLYVMHLGYNNYQVYCRVCDCTGPLAESHDEAVQKWNHRHRTSKQGVKRGPYKRKKGMDKRRAKHEVIMEAHDAT